MGEIVADNNYIIGSLGHLYMLIAFAERRTESLGIAFKREDYKWILGINIIADIETHHSYIDHLASGPMTFLGIVVEPDYNNPNNVQLWENITDKV